MDFGPYPKMPEAEKAIWTAALRSGTFEQTRHILYCCFGVHLKVVRGLLPSRPQCINVFPDAEFWQKSVGIDTHAISALIKMNDDGSSFAEIADWIEANL